MKRRAMSRRALLPLAGGLAVGAPVAALLAACGGAPPTPTPSVSSTSSRATPTAASSSPATLAASTTSSAVGGGMPAGKKELVSAQSVDVTRLEPRMSTGQHDIAVIQPNEICGVANWLDWQPYGNQQLELRPFALEVKA